jgi:hypothetical protein
MLPASFGTDSGMQNIAHIWKVSSLSVIQAVLGEVTEEIIAPSLCNCSLHSMERITFHLFGAKNKENELKL